MTDYFCAKFGDFAFSRFGFIMRTDRHTDRQIETESHDADDDYRDYVGVSNNTHRRIDEGRETAFTAYDTFLIYNCIVYFSRSSSCFVTHADGSRGSKAIMASVCVILCICFMFVRTIKPER